MHISVKDQTLGRNQQICDQMFKAHVCFSVLSGEPRAFIRDCE